MFTAWLSPPIVPLLQVYVYNITNSLEVMEGRQPVTQELGPYVYSAAQSREVVQVTPPCQLRHCTGCRNDIFPLQDGGQLGAVLGDVLEGWARRQGSSPSKRLGVGRPEKRKSKTKITATS